MTSRLKLTLIKSYEGYKVGTRIQMRREKAQGLIDNKIAVEYTGQWPPKKKTKFNLNDLR